ncbi:MAG: hypothetical protein JSR60_06460 [Proteobacteria bacterium]|nr:hypothetical protein [Pseudomonadota bacterium]
MFGFKKVAPFGLRDGLLLERSGRRLLWTASLDDLKATASQIQDANPRSIGLKWTNEEVLGGWPAEISHRSHKPQTFFVRPVLEGNLSTVEQAYGQMLKQLRHRIGRPHHANKATLKNYPMAQWRFEQVMVSLTVGETFYQYTSLSVQRLAAGT